MRTEDFAVRFRRSPDAPPPWPIGHKTSINDAPPYEFAYARTALKFGLKALGLGSSHAVLVPEFICDSAVEPLRTLEIKPVYYEVTQGLEPDWQRLESRIETGTRALLVVHYFGQPQDVAACESFCERHALMFIEDNAHGFGSELGGRPLGTFGRIGVASPRKSCPVFDGAYLYCRENLPVETRRLRVRPLGRRTSKRWVGHALGRVPGAKALLRRRRHSLELAHRLGPPPPYGSQKAFRDAALEDDYGMSRSTQAVLDKLDTARIRRVRQQIYRLWHEWTAPRGLRPVFPVLAEGAAPLVFPAFAETGSARNEWFERGHRAGIDIHSWPTLPEEIVQRDGAAMRLWERLVCFPIHQEMDAELLMRRLSQL